MSMITVALLQISAAGNDRDANLAKGEAACRAAKAMGADIALFPEMWSVGYTPAARLDPDSPDMYRSPEQWAGQPPVPTPPAEEVWAGLALGRDAPFVQHFRELAVELDLAIGLTYLEQWPGLPRNTMSLIDRHGDLVLTYAKVHTCVFSPHEYALNPGDEFPVCALDTSAGPVMVGAMICYDWEFPESGRLLMLAGAELVLAPSATSTNVHRLTQIRVRAAENMFGVAVANYPRTGGGHSVAYHPVAYLPDSRPRDTLVVEAGEAEGIYPATFDLDQLRDYRRSETWGNAFRRPAMYGALSDSAVRDPFVRVDHDGEPAPTRTVAAINARNHDDSGFADQRTHVPEPIRQAADGERVVPVWANGDGGVTYEIGSGARRRFAK